MGAITGAISSGVPAAINALVKPKPSVPQEVKTETPTQEPPVKTEQASPGNNGKSLKYSVSAGDFYGRTVDDLPPASLDRGSFDGAKGGNIFGLKGGNGVFGEKGLKIGNYRMDLMYANPSAGQGAGTIFSLKQMKQGGAQWRWDYGQLHSTGNMGFPRSA